MFLIYPSSDATEAVFAKLVLVPSASAMRSVAVVVVVVVVRSAPVAGCSSAHCTSSPQSLGSRTGRHTATPCPDTRTRTTNPRPPRKTRNVFVKFALAGKFETIVTKNNILSIILKHITGQVSTDNIRSICRYLWATFLSINIISAGMRLMSPRPWPLTPDSHLS